MLLEECKYIVKEKTMLKHITDDIKIFSDEENSVKTNSDEGWIKHHDNIFFEGPIFDNVFVREQYLIMCFQR